MGNGENGLLFVLSKLLGFLVLVKLFLNDNELLH